MTNNFYDDLVHIIDGLNEEKTIKAIEFIKSLNNECNLQPPVISQDVC